VHRGLLGFALRRAVLAVALVAVVSSSALLLVRYAPGDGLSGFGVDPQVAAAERHRLGLDRPFLAQYVTWVRRVVRMDFGESLKYRRPVLQLIRERAGNTMLLGLSALLLATLIGIPAGIATGSRTGPLAALVRSLAVVLISVPPLVTSFALLLFAAATGWLPVGGFPAPSSSEESALRAISLGRYLVLPVLALALPLSASIERLQSRAMHEALSDPCILAALARGLPRRRVIWRHGLRLSLKPVLAVYGMIVGSVLSGSFVVEIVMSWPGLGALMYEALVARDLFLVAGCAAAGSAFLAIGVFLSDIALAAVDPRIGETA
jgi:peptide/nickel transport system permease protein